MGEEARPSEGIITQQSCCVTKAAPHLQKPTLCGFLEKSGGTLSCPSVPTKEDLDVQAQAQCDASVCVSEVSLPGSTAWTQAEARLKIATSDYIAEEALVAQNLQAM